MKKVGLIVNPIAGMGGKLGLKGTDGVVDLCRESGAVPESPSRAVEALKKLLPLKEELEIITFPHEMGEDEARAAGLENIKIVGTINPGNTTSEDTKKAATLISQYGVDLLLFAGGDGTARDVYSAVDGKVVVLGIPAGVKIHSAVYAVNPRRAGDVAYGYLVGKIRKTKEAEVMDLDEDAFRSGRVIARLFGYMTVPDEPVFVQGAKAGGRGKEEVDVENIAFRVLDEMKDGWIYIIGPGTTTKVIKDKIGEGGTLLGVDLVLDKKFIGYDVNEKKILEIMETSGKPAAIIVTIIGGQGLIFGRGNQQISPKVIKKVGRENIIVVATKHKLAGLGNKPLLVDTGDEEIDRMLEGYIRVITGYHEQRLWKVSQ